MATENILMEAVKQNGDRQELHERIRVHSMDAAKVVKEEGRPNDLIERIANDPLFNINIEKLNDVLAPENYIGRSKEQVEEFLSEQVFPLLKKNNAKEINVELMA